MNKGILIGAGVVLAIFLLLPLAAQLKKQGTAAGGAESTPAAAGALAPPAWNADNLPGTAWVVSGVTVQIQSGGTASAMTPIGQVSGTWTVNGSNLTVSAMGRTINAQISGDQILVDGEPAQRAQ